MDKGGTERKQPQRAGRPREYREYCHRQDYLRWMRVEEQLEASRARYAELYDSAPVGYATLDRNGCIREINRTGATVLGRKYPGLIGGTLLSLVNRSDQRKFLSYLNLLRRGASSLSTELHFRRPDKTVVLLQLVSDSSPAANGDPAAIRTVFADVTERRRIEIQHNEARAELAAITATIADAIISVGADYRIVQLNAAAEVMFCCRATKAIGQPIWRFIREGSRAAAERIFRAFSLGGFPFQHLGALDELWGLRANGEEFPLEASLSQTDVAGQKRLTLVMRDVTERKRAEDEIRRLTNDLEERVRERTEQLEAANRELRREIAERRYLQQQILKISEREQRRIGQDLHDGIGQQLTGLMLLNDARLKKLSLGATTDIAEVRRISYLLSQAKVLVHQLSRGLLPVSATPNGLMIALSHLAQGVSNLHGVDCGFRCRRDVLVPDNVVATHLFRIAQEAINNSIRHGRSRTIRLTLQEADGRVRLAVQDDGRRFTLLETPAGSGGLGLQIMKSRCEAIGATLSISPLRPHGTRVQCEAPLVQPSQTED